MFLSAFLAGTILPFSSEVVLLACVGLGLDPVWSTLFTTAGNALGGVTCYWIGRMGKTEWIEKYFKVDKKQMDRAVRFIHGRGSWMAFFSFLPVIGDALLIALGFMRGNFWITTLAMTIGNWHGMPSSWPRHWAYSNISNKKPAHIFLTYRICVSLQQRNR